MIMSTSIHYIEIPKEIYDKLKPCWKCGKKPIMTEINESYCCKLYTEFRIHCPDEKCYNFYCIEDKDDFVNKWNKQNVEKYVPKSELKESKQNCRHCKYVDRCVNVREQRIAQFFDAHVCDDFKAISGE